MKYVFIGQDNVVCQTLITEPPPGKTADDVRDELAAESGLTVLVSDDPAAVCGAIWDGEKFTLPAPPTPALDLDIQADKTVAAIGETINITAQLRVHGTSHVASMDQWFAVPVEGADAMIKGVQFTQGVANVEMIFSKSGLYRITEAGINSKLPDAQRIALAREFEVVVYVP